MDREKQTYDFESLQSQLDKALGQAARLQKERDTAQLDADRFRDKHDKSQVSFNILVTYLSVAYILGEWRRRKEGARNNSLKTWLDDLFVALIMKVR